MARQKGTPMYARKSVQGSYYITKVAAEKMRRAAKRTGKSASDVIDFCLRKSADALTKAEADALAAPAP